MASSGKRHMDQIGANLFKKVCNDASQSVNKALKVSPQKALALAGLVKSESLNGKTPEGQGVQEVAVWPPSYTKLERVNDTEKKKVITHCISGIDAAALTKLKAMDTKVVARMFWRCTFLNSRFQWPQGLPHRKDLFIQIMIAWIQERCQLFEGMLFNEYTYMIDWNDNGFFSLCDPEDGSNRITHVKFIPTGETGPLPDYITANVGEGWVIEGNYDLHEAVLTNKKMPGITVADSCLFLEKYSMQQWVAFCVRKAQELCEAYGREEEQVASILASNSVNAHIHGASGSVPVSGPVPVTPTRRPSPGISTPQTGTPEEHPGRQHGGGASHVSLGLGEAQIPKMPNLESPSEAKQSGPSPTPSSSVLENLGGQGGLAIHFSSGGLGDQGSLQGAISSGGPLQPFSAGLGNEQLMMRILAQMAGSCRPQLSLPPLPAGAMRLCPPAGALANAVHGANMDVNMAIPSSPEPVATGIEIEMEEVEPPEGTP